MSRPRLKNHRNQWLPKEIIEHRDRYQRLEQSDECWNQLGKNTSNRNNSLKNKRSDIICKWSIYVSSENTKTTVQYDIVEIIRSEQQLKDPKHYITVWRLVESYKGARCFRFACQMPKTSLKLKYLGQFENSNYLPTNIVYTLRIFAILFRI